MQNKRKDLEGSRKKGAQPRVLWRMTHHPVPRSRPPLYLLPTPHPKRPAPSPRGRRRARRPHLRRLGGGGGGGAGPSPAHPCASSPVRSGSRPACSTRASGATVGHLARDGGGARGNAELTLWGPSPPLDAVARVTERHFRPLPPAQRLHTRSSDRGGRLASNPCQPYSTSDPDSGFQFILCHSRPFSLSAAS